MVGLDPTIHAWAVVLRATAPVIHQTATVPRGRTVQAWIPGSSRRHFVAASPEDDEPEMFAATRPRVAPEHRLLSSQAAHPSSPTG